MVAAPFITPPARPIAIFRVVPVAEGFAFTRRLSGAGVYSFETATERFGPYATERAAHALALRAAARFSAQSPEFLVEVREQAQRLVEMPRERIGVEADAAEVAP